MTRPFTGWHMAAIMISFFAVIISVNLTMAFFARSSWTGLVVKNSYLASQSFNRDAEIARQQQALGWHMTLSVKRDAVDLSVVDRDNQAMTGLRIRAVLQRPADEVGDQHLKLQESGAGKYRTNAVIGGGVWVADITVEKSDNELVRFVQRIFVE